MNHMMAVDSCAFILELGHKQVDGNMDPYQGLRCCLLCIFYYSIIRSTDHFGVFLTPGQLPRPEAH